ncbi:ribonuclease 3-like protein 2 [Apium graveolens]|uniref:ribonuclease 3-like protein 2 n=1 Tax=Apium graveolens TaxID=4045 RepID=UPI003D7A3C11
MSAPPYNPVITPKKDDNDYMDINDAINAIEEMLNYQFKDKSSIEMALTHPSYTNSVSKSYQRLEFLGDAVLGSMIASNSYLTYPDHDPCHLSLVTAANVSTENLARVAIRTGLYKYLRHHVAAIDEKVLFYWVVYFRVRND